MAAEDLSYQKFNRLTALYRVKDHISPSGHKFTQWMCLCDCGNYVVVRAAHLKNGNTKSCGCLHREKSAQNGKVHCMTHGETHTRLYNIWRAMRARCNRETTAYYEYYGGRGITVCDEWLVFENFSKWSWENGYDETLTIDRIDNDGNYEPSNCRWVTPKVQHNNMSTNRYCEWNGVTKTASEWAEKYGLSGTLVRQRLNRGWSIEDALLKPPKNTSKRTA